MVVEKQKWRQKRRDQITLMSVSEKKSQSDVLVQKLKDFLQDRQQTWSLYSPLEDEPNLMQLVNQVPTIRWAFPKVQSKTEMQFFIVDSLDDLKPGVKGIKEPLGEAAKPIQAEQIDGMIIPGLAYDRSGIRLGWGGGFYDRYLSHYTGHKLGVTFVEGLVEGALPRQAHDQLMNTVVSPKEWVEVKTNEVSYGI